MAQTVTTYNFSKRQNSTKKPTSGGTNHTVTLKDPTSLIHPVFILQSFSRTDNYLKWGDRYYFITDIVQRTNNTAEYHCIVDPLASWKTQIGQQSEYVVRAASAHNDDVVDMAYPVTADMAYGYVSFQGLNTAIQAQYSSGTFVLGVVGMMGAASGSISYYALDANQMGQLLNFMFTGTWLDLTEVDISIVTQKELVNPFQYIVSCNWFPLSISGTSSSIWFGWWDSGIYAGLLSQSQREQTITDSITIPKHPHTSSRGRYLNLPPFTEYYANIYCFGLIPLDPAPLVNCTQLVPLINVDLFGGGSSLSISGFDGTSSYGVYKGWAQFGVPVQLAQLNQSIMSPVTNIIGGALSMATGDFIGYASGIGNAIHSMMPQVQTAGSTGTAIDFASAAGLSARFRKQTEMDATHKGRPVCGVLTINTLSGYIECDNVSVDIPCTQEERDLIQHFMTGGFYYE